MHLTNKQLLKLLSLVIVGIALLAGVLNFLNANRAFINNELTTLDLLPKPERLTELYFNDSANLPSSTPRDHIISFAFVIHNLETTDYLYIYEVSINVNGTRYIVDSGSVLVKNNHYYVKNERFKVVKSSGRQEIVSELVNKQQSIDFWIGNT